MSCVFCGGPPHGLSSCPTGGLFSGTRPTPAPAHGGADPSQSFSSGTYAAAFAAAQNHVTLAQVAAAAAALKAAGAAAGLAPIGGPAFPPGGLAPFMGGGPSAQQMLLMHQQMQAMIESATPLETAPMSVGEFVGWRIWQVRSRERLLLSYSANAIWMPGEPMDGKPSDHGDEGVWCFKDKMRAFQKAASEASINLCAVGSVYLWGNVVEHEIGYRAEFAEVRSIDHAPGAPYLLSALRARYGVGSAEDADSADQHAERGIGRGGAAVVDDC